MPESQLDVGTLSYSWFVTGWFALRLLIGSVDQDEFHSNSTLAQKSNGSIELPQNVALNFLRHQCFHQKVTIQKK